MNRRIQGKISKQKGRLAESMFEGWCRHTEYNHIECVRIEDAVKFKGSFVGRARQIGDYALLCKGLTAFADVKWGTPADWIPSNLRQLQMWREYREKTGNDNFLFVFVRMVDSSPEIVPAWLGDFDRKDWREGLMVCPDPDYLFHPMMKPEDRRHF